MSQRERILYRDDNPQLVGCTSSLDTLAENDTRAVQASPPVLFPPDSNGLDSQSEPREAILTSWNAQASDMFHGSVGMLPHPQPASCQGSVDALPHPQPVKCQGSRRQVLAWMQDSCATQDEPEAPLQPHLATSQSTHVPRLERAKRGPFRNPELRQETARTRSMGSCMRCRMYRTRCTENPQNTGGPCLGCSRLLASKQYRVPCSRYRLRDVTMNCYSRPTGSREAYQGIRTVMNPMARGVSSNVQVIHVSERNTDADTYMELHVQTLGHFPPESDAAAESQGQQVPVLADSYALVSLREAKQQYLQYIQASLGRTLRTSLGRRSGILYQTYLRAYYTMKDDSASQETRHLLVLTFKLWMSIRLSSKPIVMIGAQDVDEHGTPQPDGRPTWTALPPNIVMQLDYVLTGQIQMELREKVLSGLDNMVYKRKQRNWLTIYLATFILLHNLALIKADNGTCTAKCRTERCKHELAAEEYHKSANNLLAHFHFCNNGVQPFSEACPSYRLADLLDGNDDTVKFIQNCRSHVRLHRQHWDAIRRNCQYDDEYFFISQLFDDRWAPHPMESERPRGPSLAQMV